MKRRKTFYDFFCWEFFCEHFGQSFNWIFLLKNCWIWKVKSSKENIHFSEDAKGSEIEMISLASRPHDFQNYFFLTRKIVKECQNYSFIFYQSLNLFFWFVQCKKLESLIQDMIPISLCPFYCNFRSKKCEHYFLKMRENFGEGFSFFLKKHFICFFFLKKRITNPFSISGVEVSQHKRNHLFWNDKLKEIIYVFILKKFSKKVFSDGKENQANCCFFLMKKIS